MSPCIPYGENGVAVACAREGSGERARARPAALMVICGPRGARRYTHAQIMLRAREFFAPTWQVTTPNAHISDSRVSACASRESEDSPQTPSTCLCVQYCESDCECSESGSRERGVYTAQSRKCSFAFE